MLKCIYGCQFIQNYDKRFFSKLKKVRKIVIFIHFYHFSPPAPQRDFSECLRALLYPERCRLLNPHMCQTLLLRESESVFHRSDRFRP